MNLKLFGELFKDCDFDFIYGPVLLHAFPLTNTYLIGVNHSFGAEHSIKNEHIWNIIKTFCLNNPTKKIHLVLEAADIVDLYFIKDNSYSPLTVAITDCFRGIPANLSTYFGNIRRIPPLNILEAIYDQVTFISHNSNKLTCNDAFKFISLAKQFERDFYNNVSSRKKCIDFFISIISPYGLYPKWFEYYLKQFGISNTINPLRDMIRNIGKSDPEFKNAILSILGKMFDYTVTENSEYSPAMSSLEKTLNTKSSNMVTTHYKPLQDFWISINAIFMDIYILCLMKKHSKESDIFIVMAGFNHIDNIYRNLSKEYKKSSISSFSKDAILNTNNIVPSIKLHVSPNKLLRNFRNARKAALKNK